MGRGGGDIEMGSTSIELHRTMMMETPALRWAFIRKVYVIVASQLLLTSAVVATVVFIKPIQHFILDTHPGLAVYIVSIILPFILLWPLLVYHKCHPVNLVLLALFNISLAFGIGLTCARTEGTIILTAAILTTLVVVGLTLYTFWADGEGHDFSFLGAFWCCALLVALAFSLIVVIFPLGKIPVMGFCCLVAYIFCGYLVYDTQNLIKRFSYDEYIWAALSLYLDVVNLFLGSLGIAAADS